MTAIKTFHCVDDFVKIGQILDIYGNYDGFMPLFCDNEKLNAQKSSSRSQH